LGEADETPNEVLVDFLRGRVNLEKVAPVVGIDGGNDGVSVRELIKESGNRLVRMVRELV
jgi:hypothetical protein